MSERSPLDDFTVRNVLLGNDPSSADAETLSALFFMPDGKRDKVVIAVKTRILKERDGLSTAECLHLLGKREHGPDFVASTMSPSGLLKAVTSSAGADVTAAADAIFEVMTDAEKAELIPPRKSEVPKRWRFDGTPVF